jgi:hypothetical protein
MVKTSGGTRNQRQSSWLVERCSNEAARRPVESTADSCPSSEAANQRLQRNMDGEDVAAVVVRS